MGDPANTSRIAPPDATAVNGAEPIAVAHPVEHQRGDLDRSGIGSQVGATIAGEAGGINKK